MSPWRAWSRGRQRDRAASSCPSGRQETGIPRLPNPNHHRYAECRRAPLTPYLLPGERLLDLRPRRINLCRSSPYAHSSTTAASAVASASSNVNRCLPPCGFADAPARPGPGFLQASCRLVFFFCGRILAGGPIAVVLCRWMLELSGNVPDRTVVWLVHLPILSGTEGGGSEVSQLL